MSVVAGVVSFNPGSSLVDLCRSLQTQGCAVVIVDNASTDGLEVLELCRSAGAQVRKLDANLGVAGALEALLTSMAGEEWLLLFDQDSKIDSAYVGAITQSLGVRDDRVAIVGPIIRDEATGQLLQGDSEQQDWYKTIGVLTSGSLCRIAALRDVGGPRPELFIDYVDWDLCLRLRHRGWSIAIEPSAVLLHALGESRTRLIRGRKWTTTTNHGPDRLYYRYRNYLLLWRAGTFRGHGEWAIRHARSLAWGPAKVVLLERNRAAKLAAIASGLRHGFIGRGGSRPKRRGGARST